MQPRHAAGTVSRPIAAAPKIPLLGRKGVRLFRARKFAQVPVHEDLIRHLVGGADHELDRKLSLHLHLVVVPREMIDREWKTIAKGADLDHRRYENEDAARSNFQN